MPVSAHAQWRMDSAGHSEVQHLYCRESSLCPVSSEEPAIKGVLSSFVSPDHGKCA